MRSPDLDPSDYRIAHVVNRLGPGGVARVAYELMTRLPPGQRPYLYCLAGGNDHRTETVEQAERLRLAGIPVRFPSSDDRFTAGRELASWLREDRIDLVHTHSTKPNQYARPVAMAAGVATVAHFHNHYDDKWNSAEMLHREQDLAARTDGFIACSASVRDHVSSRVGLPASSIQVIRNGVETDRFAGGDGERVRAELGIAVDAPVIGTVGRLSRQKAQDDFLRAVPLIARRYGGAVFLVVGRADESRGERELRDLSMELGVADRVRFTGFRDDLPDIYAALDVCVLPSRWEGFGLVLAEAMAAGVPLVATAVGPVPGVVGDAGLLVPVDRPDRIAAAVEGLLASPDTARRLVERGRVRAAQLGWRQPAVDLAEYYDALLARAS